MKRLPKAPAPRTKSPDGLETTRHGADLFTSAGSSAEGLLDFLRAITDNLGEGTYALDTAGLVTFMNPAAERMLGWTEAELRGKEMHAAIHFQHADGSPFPREECPLLRVLQSREIDRVEDDTFTRRDGSMFPVAYVSSPIITNGVMTGAVLAFHDITEHKALDEALKRSEREAASRASQMTAVFESIADAILVFDDQGNISQTNAADAEMLAVRESRHPLAPTLQARHEQLNFRDESGQPLTQGQWPTDRVLRCETLRGESAVDVVFRALDGRDVTVNVSGAPVRDSAGTITGGVLIRRDVTRRRRLERQTREALTALMAMGEALVTATGAREPTDGLLRITGIARKLAELTHAVMGCERVNIVVNDPTTGQMRAVGVAGLRADQEETWRATWPRAGRSSDYLPAALIERLDAGETLYIDRTLPPFNRWPNPFGSRTLLVLPMRIGERHLGDVSLDYGAPLYQPSADEMAMAVAITRLAAQIVERERLARDREMARANALALTETTRRMDEFLSIAAHELKTPVTNSALTVALATDTVRAAARAAAAGPGQEGLASALGSALATLERAEGHMDRLSRLVVDLLDVSRIRVGKLELRVAPHNLADLVREVVEEQRQMTPGRVILLRLPSGSRMPPIVSADADRIRQVVSNYLSNALKYSRESQRAYVSVRADGEWARVSVRDEGPGVPAAERPRVWERFYRTPGTQVMSGVGVGLGLGLHISKTIIEQHHGRCGVRNARGRGAIFWFALRQMV